MLARVCKACSPLAETCREHSSKFMLILFLAMVLTVIMYTFFCVKGVDDDDYYQDIEKCYSKHKNENVVDEGAAQARSAYIKNRVKSSMSRCEDKLHKNKYHLKGKFM